MHKDQRPLPNRDFLEELFPASEDISKCQGSLLKLAQHLKEPVVITGSMATGSHLLKSSRQQSEGHLNDIDTVAVVGLSGICPSLSQDFLINHFHPSRDKGKVLLQLVDEEHGMRIDVFTSRSNSLAERLTDCVIGDLSCRVVSVEDVLANLLSVIHPVTKGELVALKDVKHFDLLFKIADKPLAGKVWADYRKESQPLSFAEATKSVQRSVSANPNLLQATSYCQDVNYVCAWCHESELFPLAPRRRIREILGYV